MIKCDENKPYLFVSYAHKDSDRVHEIINIMSDEGYNVWYDEGIDPGTEWDQNIADHIKGCSSFVAFVSVNYLASENCKDELNYARDLDKERFIVYLEEVNLPDGMAMRMNRIQAIWWNKYEGVNIQEAYAKLFSTPCISKTKIRQGKGRYVTPVINRATVAPMLGSFVPDEQLYEIQNENNNKLPMTVWISLGVIVFALIIGTILLVLL